MEYDGRTKQDTADFAEPLHATTCLCEEHLEKLKLTQEEVGLQWYIYIYYFLTSALK